MSFLLQNRKLGNTFMTSNMLVRLSLGNRLRRRGGCESRKFISVLLGSTRWEGKQKRQFWAEGEMNLPCSLRKAPSWSQRELGWCSWEFLLEVRAGTLNSEQSLEAGFITCFPGGSEVKASACNVGDLGSISGSGRSPGEGNGNPLQYSCLENPMDGGA